jgi:hypothetical protein
MVQTFSSHSAFARSDEVQVQTRAPQSWRMTLLAPGYGESPNSCKRVLADETRTAVDAEKHTKILRSIQSMRGEVYREYDPIAAELLSDGRHYDPLDDQSWHIVLHTPAGYILGSSRYRIIENGFEQLAVSRSALAFSLEYGSLLKSAVECHIQQALLSGIRYGEAGMWALRPEVRCSTAAVTLVLMTFALAAALGGGLGITTATTRHGSSSILQRLGGSTFPGLPSYYEPKYGCMIEIVQFDSANLDSRYRGRMRRVEAELANCDVICTAARRDSATVDHSSSRTVLDLLALGKHVAMSSAPAPLYSENPR